MPNMPNGRETLPAALPLWAARSSARRSRAIRREGAAPTQNIAAYMGTISEMDDAALERLMALTAQHEDDEDGGDMAYGFAELPANLPPPEKTEEEEVEEPAPRKLGMPKMGMPPPPTVAEPAPSFVVNLPAPSFVVTMPTNSVAGGGAAAPFDDDDDNLPAPSDSDDFQCDLLSRAISRDECIRLHGELSAFLGSSFQIGTVRQQMETLRATLDETLENALVMERLHLESESENEMLRDENEMLREAALKSSDAAAASAAQKAWQAEKATMEAEISQLRAQAAALKEAAEAEVLAGSAAEAARARSAEAKAKAAKAMAELEASRAQAQADAEEETVRAAAAEVRKAAALDAHRAAERALAVDLGVRPHLEAHPDVEPLPLQSFDFSDIPLGSPPPPPSDDGPPGEGAGATTSGTSVSAKVSAGV